jgi:hypothetical protein
MRKRWESVPFIICAWWAFRSSSRQPHSDGASGEMGDEKAMGRFLVAEARCDLAIALNISSCCIGIWP